MPFRVPSVLLCLRNHTQVNQQAIQPRVASQYCWISLPSSASEGSHHAMESRASFFWQITDAKQRRTASTQVMPSLASSCQQLTTRIQLDMIEGWGGHWTQRILQGMDSWVIVLVLRVTTSTLCYATAIWVLNANALTPYPACLEAPESHGMCRDHRCSHLVH